MSIARTGHRAVLLNDGRVLIIGGNNSAGVVTGSCEIFDPMTNSFRPTGSLVQPRTAHAATTLSDGRVLVSGGMANYQNVALNFTAVLNSTVNTAEIWDPASGTWSFTTTPMNSTRSGHQQLMLPNGNVILLGGVRGGYSSAVFTTPYQIPVFTNAVETFNPTTGLFTGIQWMTTPRGFHGASVLSSGEVLVTGGFVAGGTYNQAVATNTCELLSPTGWVTAPPLLEAVGFHTQLASPTNQEAVIFGGFTGDLTTLASTDSASRHWGGGIFPTIPIGQHPLTPAATPGMSPLAAHQAVVLYDGSYLVCGGSDTTMTSSRAYIIVEN